MSPPPCPPARKATPARARRSKLRLEKFQRKKIEEKAQAAVIPAEKNISENATGDNSNKLVIVLENTENNADEITDTGNMSPILQVDGILDMEDDQSEQFSFLNNYAKEDIIYTLDEIFPEKNCSLESYEQCKPRSADHICTIILKDTTKKFTWPLVKDVQKDVIRDLKTGPR